jgi:DNA-binding NarL/FixJ family response regulator
MDEVRVLLATERRTLLTFFVDRQCEGRPRLVASLIPVDPCALPGSRELVASATVAVVDIAADPRTAVQLCQELRARRTDLPIVAILCCPTAAAPWHVESLLDAGVRGILDVHATAEVVTHTVEVLAGGDTSLHVRLRPEFGFCVDRFLAGREAGEPRRSRAPTEADLRLLKLLARGLTDAEIGQRLHISRNTVHHQIRRLCAQTGTRNRQGLAAWAGHHGLFQPDDGQDSQ